MENAIFNGDIKEKIKELENIETNKLKITKKLKFYEFDDFLNVSDKIEEYLSELTDEIESFLTTDMDVQSINFLLYELFINIYKHSKFKNAYLQLNHPHPKRGWGFLNFFSLNRLIKYFSG